MTKQEALKWFQLRKKMCLSDRTQEAEDIAIECIASVIAQEPVAPFKNAKTGMAFCGVCKGALYDQQKYCHMCGRKAKWDDD